MLRKKRGKPINKHPKLEQKTLEEKLKSIKKDKKEEDESIESDIEDSEESSESEKKETKKLETTDDIRLRQAKELIKKLENKEDLSSSENIEEQSEDQLLKKITQESNKSKTKYFNTTNFNPTETLFIKGHKASITDLDIFKDSTKVITASKDKRSIIFDIQKQAKTLLPKFADRPLTCCLLSSDNKTAYYGCKDKYIYQIDLNSYNIIQKFKAHNAAVTGIAIDTTKEQFYSIGNDNLLKVWSTDTIKAVELETFYGHTNKINCIQIIPSDINHIITSGMDNYINYWKVDSQSFLQYNINDIYPIDCLSPINESYFISGNFNGDVYIWKTNKKKPIYKALNMHGYNKDFKLYNNFFDDTNSNIYTDIKIGNPILSMYSFYNSDLCISGSCEGIINLYNFENNDKINFTKEKSIQLTNKGCLNVIKGNKEGNMIIIGNGNDAKNGRWNSEYNIKTGISIVKLFNS